MRRKLQHMEAPDSAEYSRKMVDRALYIIDIKAQDLEDGQTTMCEFNGEYRALQRLNMPIHCKKSRTKTRSGRPIFHCFKFPGTRKGQR